ncbi:class I SAM-dependent methyltransferase [Demequina sp. NBRC 110051]|uniref:class I SAM-dependent methyltransferase n=1 Tax=Demequina sp. NBRC 110051 TaxID=1570340 RepID=UPI000A059023|nr:class I SAM-dependent methyltransferase [Demequina sp. NBRC 110051]
MTATEAVSTPTPTAPLATTAVMLTEMAAGYVGTRTLQIGLESGLIEALAAHPDSAAWTLASEAGTDPFYTRVWLTAAIAHGLVERSGDEGARLADNVSTLLLAAGHPAHMGALFRVLEEPEIFARFHDRLATGTRTWWDECGPRFIDKVAGTGLPFYVRLVRDGLAAAGEAHELLDSGGVVLDTACGAGAGLVELAQAFPRARVVGVDGDAHSIALARDRIVDAGLDGRVSVTQTALEDLALDARFDVVINNIAMHECRDIDEVTRRVRTHLKPGGWFVISDFPFPDNDEALRSLPGRVMSGIQFFEAQIDDQLQPVGAYLELLSRHGFDRVGTVALTPMHAITFGRRPLPPG